MMIIQYVIPGAKGLKEVKPLLVYKSIVRNVVKKIMCNDRFIALKMKAETLSILLVQLCMKITKMEEMYNIIKEILLEEDR